MAAPTEEQIQQLWDLHNSPERAKENALRAYGFDSVSTWKDSRGFVLSDRIWRARQNVYDQIDRVLREAIANGTDALEVARILEQFLDPSLAPVRNERGILKRNQAKAIVTRAPGRGGMGSFSARRLARTEITRAHGQATIEASKRTPFALGVKWNLSGSHPRSDICDQHSRANDYDLGPGVYPPDKVPQYPSHPQDLCTLSTATERDVDSVVARLREQYALDVPGTAEVINDSSTTQETVRQRLPNDNGLLPFPDDKRPRFVRIEAQHYAHDEAVGQINALDDASESLLKQFSSSYFDELPIEERTAIHRYTYDAFSDVNLVARGKKNADHWVLRSEEGKQRVLETTRLLDSAIPKGKLTEDVGLFRGMSGKQVSRMAAKWTPGDVVTDWGFVSTSTKKYIATEFLEREKVGVMLHLRAPAGMPATMVSKYSVYAGQYEVVMPRGTSYIVHKIEKQGDVVQVWADILMPET